MPSPAGSEAGAPESVAAITGAGSGIGRAVALELAQRGWRLALAGRRRPPLEETARLAAERAGASAERFLVHPSDVAVAAECAALIAATVKRFGGVDALVNNAGLAPPVPIAETTPETLRDVFAVNALGPGYLITFVWRAFVARGGGRIVNVSSVAAFDPYPGLFAYGGAKAALHAMTKACATEGERIGVKAFAVAPGAVETKMLRGIVDEATLPPSQTLDPEDVAAVIVACVAGERDEDNGEVITIASPR